jgi:hypothetical protein
MTLAFLRRLWPLAAVAVLLALAAVAAAHSSLRFSPVNAPAEDLRGVPEYSPDRPTPSFPTRSGEVAPADQTALPGWVTTVAGALCVAVVAVLAGLLLWLLIRDLLRRRTRPLAPEQIRRSSARTAEEVVAALDAGLVDLSDADTDPRRAVIACWVRLEQAAAAAGLPRQVGDTPTDLVSRLLTGRANVSADVLAAFAHVYREARYATHAVDERMRAQARSALQRLRAELTSAASSAEGRGVAVKRPESGGTSAASGAEGRGVAVKRPESGGNAGVSP